MTYVKANVARPALNAGAGGNKKDKIIVFDWDDVDTYTRDGATASAITMVATTGKQYTVYATVSTIDANYKVEGDEDAEGFMHQVKFDHPGDALAIMDFIQNWTGKNCGIIIEKCSGTDKIQYGTPCAPLKLKASGVDTKDKLAQTMEFTASVKSPYVPAHFTGTLTLAE